MHKRRLLALVAALGLLAGCSTTGNATPVPDNGTTNTQAPAQTQAPAAPGTQGPGEAYPAPVQATPDPNAPYPLPTFEAPSLDAYPTPTS